MRARRPRAVLVGLDAFDPDLARTWAREGALPTLARLLREGAAATTRNSVGFYIGAVWPTLYTATSPARHGRTCFEQWVPGTYRTRRTTPEDVAAPPFWVALGRAGVRVAAFDVPFAPDRPPPGGVLVRDWGTHDAPPESFATEPADLRARILSEFGENPVGFCHPPRRTAPEVAAFRAGLVARADVRARIAARLLDDGPDLLFVVFSESHCAGHQLWHHHDPSHERHDPSLRRALGDPLKEVYRGIDAALGRLLDRVGDDATHVVLASHGMGPHHDGSRLVREILDRIDASRPGGRPPSLRARVERLLDRRRLHRLSKKLGGLLPIPVSRAHGRAFAIPNNDEWLALRANVVGREPRGRVEPSEVDDYLTTLAADLTEIVHAGTREPVFREVVRARDAYPSGPACEGFPDLLLAWNRDRPVHAVESPRIGRVEGRYHGVRTGDHRPDGLLLARGPGIAAGEVGAVRAEDVAPTVAACLGVALDGVDGRPVPEIAGARAAVR